MGVVAAYSNTEEQQEKLVIAHATMVKRIAHHLMGRLPQAVLLDDLIQAGMMGLLEAARNYDATKGASFETYAGIRIRGHMLDEVRRNDWVPRSVYRNSRMISSAVKTVENREGRDAKDTEVAQEMDLSLSDYHHLLKDSTAGQLYGFDDLGVSDDVLHVEASNKPEEPFADIQREDLYKRLVEVIDNLPERERLVLSLYYERELNLKEIGMVLGVSESRISQIHSQAVHRVKARLPDDSED